MTPREIVLYDKDEKKVAVCLQAKGFNIGGRQDYEIYGMNPMYDGQASKTVKGIDGPVYQWMELQGIHEKPYYTVLSYKDHKEYHPLCFKGTRKSAMSKMDKGVILTSLHNDDSLIAKLFHKKLMTNDHSEGDVTGWDLKIAPGVDPLAVACVTAVLEHLEGQNI